VSEWPDHQVDWRKSFITVATLGALVALAGSALLRGEREVVAAAPIVTPAKAGTAAFSNASPDRVFLSASESREAAQRGLAASGVRSILSTGGQLAFGQWKWDTQGVPAGPIRVRVDLKRQLVSVYRGADEIGTAVVVYGIEGKDTPRGKLSILGKTRDYRSITYDAEMPYSLWLRSDGVAIHGSSVTMGHATNGCIGVPVEFAENLFDVAEKGDIVEVIG
jgi:lipoprotein-anchoring transpeptidase ErfK/SrfK